MELILLDKNLDICGILDDFSSLIWNRKYYECGNLKLQVGINYLHQLDGTKYIYCKNFREMGVLETFNYKQKESGTTLEYSGRFLESILGDRVIDHTMNFIDKTTEEIVRCLVEEFAINVSESRKIKNLVLGEYKNLGNKKTIQITGDNLLDKIYELCKEDELSISLDFDFEAKKSTFNVWKGLDRRDTQNINSWAIFSNNFENLTDDSYSFDKTKHKNFAYVYGEGESDKRFLVEVDNTNGSERKELYVDARDLQKDESMSESEYIEMLKARGFEKLEECNLVETSTFTVNPLSNLKYKTDFDLGDYAIYRNDELGILLENRIVEVSESFEDGNNKIDVVFGKDYNLKRLKGVM